MVDRVTDLICKNITLVGTIACIHQVVAVKQLDRNGLQGNKEFIVEVLMLSLLHHDNLVNLIGYCADGDQRLLVYEYMPLRSLEDHLLGTATTTPSRLLALINDINNSCPFY